MKSISKETMIYLLIMFYIIVTTSGGYLLTYFVFTDKNEYISLVVLLSIMIFNLIVSILKIERMEKINLIDGEYESWVLVNNFDLDAEVADRVQMIYCDTRDFAIGWNFEQPKINKNANCGYEYNQNKGLQEFYQIAKKQDKEKREKYTINKKDILKWLDELCKATGGYECEWRYLDADVDYCRNWNIKYIRFIRDNKNPDEFVVCNDYFFPIEYRKIIDKIDKEYLCAH